MSNTGGPTARWNMRREYSPKPSTRRQLYYCGVDRRYHLFGATESWLEVGHLVGDKDKEDLEIRAFDSNHDGYLDTWEVLEPGHAEPVRVTKVFDPQSRLVPLSRNFLMDDYNHRVLPEAIAADKELLAELKKFASSPPADSYEQAAASSETAERQRYCLDVARELYFLVVRDALYRRNASGDYPSLPAEARRETTGLGPVDGRYTLGDTLEYWKVALQIERFVDDYGAGRLHQAAGDLEQIGAPVK
jgi:hypothetical protein